MLRVTVPSPCQHTGDKDSCWDREAEPGNWGRRGKGRLFAAETPDFQEAERVPQPHREALVRIDVRAEHTAGFERT